MTTTIIATTVTSTSATVPTFALELDIGRYTYMGCFTESTDGRALTDASSDNMAGMTLEVCESYCSGFVYWGVEYGSECYCGNIISNASLPADPNDCNMTCVGNSTEHCGAGDRLDIYKFQKSSSTPASANATLPPTSSPKITTSKAVSSATSHTTVATQLQSGVNSPSSTAVRLRTITKNTILVSCLAASLFGMLAISVW